MLRRFRREARNERGQALVLMVFGLLVIMGATAMSIDVGRAMWAKSQMQEAVDAAALAGAQSLPNTNDAQTVANEYWALNAGKILTGGNNIVFTATPDVASNKSLDVSASADIPTWFAKLLGIDHWHVTASAQAQSLVVDAMLVLDRSGSMCWDNYGPNGNYTGLVRNSSTVPNQTSNTTFTVTKHSSASSQPLTELVWVGQTFQLDSEWMTITAIGTSSITVQRARPNPNTGSSSSAASHSSSSTKWIRGSTCQQAGAAPYYPWVYIKNGANVFINSMNSTYDRIGYVHFGTRGTLSSTFTSSFTPLKATVNGSPDPTKPVGSPANGSNSDQYTNIAHGIWMGVNQHNTSARANASKVIVLLSDGVANNVCSTYNTACSSTTYNESTGYSHTITQANAAKTAKVKIYTISYGNAVDADLMQEVADITGGKHYVAPNDAALNLAFQDIAKSTHLKLSK